MKRKFHHFLKLVTSTEKLLTRAGFEFEHTVPSDSIVQLVERRTGVPEGASSNPASRFKVILSCSFMLLSAI